MDQNKCYSFKSPRTQNFSIPSNIIYYANQNPLSPNGLQKLQQTCKWFFGKNQIVVVPYKFFDDNKLPKFIAKNESTKNPKFWFTEKLCFNRWGFFGAAPLILWPKIYRCDITSLTLHFVGLKVQEFDILTSTKNLKNVSLNKFFIFDDNNYDIPLDQLLKKTPTVTEFSSFKLYDPFIWPADIEKPTITNETLKNVIEMINDNGIKNFGISGYLLSPTLDLEIFCSFIKKVAAPKASFQFYLDYSFPEQKAQFEAAVEKMLSEWISVEQKPSVYISDV